MRVSGLSARGISDLERGVRKGPRPETLRLLADALSLAGEEREKLIAVAHVEREGTGPEPPRTPTALPLPESPLFGRDEERAELIALLGRPDVRLVTVTGTGGSGKTRLALDVANRLHEIFHDGVVFVDLAPLTDPTHVMPAVAAALGIIETQGQPVARTLIAVLRAKRMLLLLDNCEQVLDAMPEIAEVLAGCPEVTILATSREALRLRGEREYPLAPLPLPNLDQLPPLDELRLSPSVALFTARAEASNPRFLLTAENARAVATVCHRVDGVPLAIELAAARVKLLSPEELAARLEQRLPLLTTGARDAPLRQRTLRDAIAWSYDLLAADERQLFRQLGVFVGGWTLAAAEAVANPAGEFDLLTGLGSLIDKSLVRVDAREPESRYGMLETVREFAVEPLDQKRERQTTRRRHAAYFLAVAARGARELEGLEQKHWLGLLEREHPNFREAFRTFEEEGDDEGYLLLANALSFFWFCHTHAVEGLQRFAVVLDREIPDAVEHAKALVGAATLAYGSGDYASAERWLDEADAVAGASEEKALLAQCALIRGVVAEHRGDEATAMACFESGLALAREVDSAWLIGEMLPNLSDAAYRAGRLDLAERFARDAIPVLRETGNSYMESMNLSNVAQVALARGDVRSAAAAIAEGLRIAEEIGSRWNVANVIAGASAVAAAFGQDSQAVQLLGAADAAREASGHPRLPQFGLFKETQERLRSRLGIDAFQANWDKGRAVPVESAVSEARAVLEVASHA